MRMGRLALITALAAIGTTACTSATQGRRVISTPDAPAAIGPYSQAIQVGGTLYLAGQIPLDPATGQLAAGGLAAQTRQAMRNAEAILRAAGYTLADVVQVQVYLSNLDQFAEFNTTYQEFFPTAAPARMVSQARIPRDALVAVLMTAAR